MERPRTRVEVGRAALWEEVVVAAIGPRPLELGEETAVLVAAAVTPVTAAAGPRTHAHAVLRAARHPRAGRARRCLLWGGRRSRAFPPRIDHLAHFEGRQDSHNRE